MNDLNIFANDRIDRMANKYQTTTERTKAQKELDAVMADIIREAVLRGEYDQEKKMWLV